MRQGLCEWAGQAVDRGAGGFRGLIQCGPGGITSSPVRRLPRPGLAPTGGAAHGRVGQVLDLGLALL